MRKLIGALLTLTALSPLTAAAQDFQTDVGVRAQVDEGGRRPDRGARLGAGAQVNAGGGVDRGDRPGPGGGFDRGDRPAPGYDRPERDPRGNDGGFQSRPYADRGDDRGPRNGNPRNDGPRPDGAGFQPRPPADRDGPRYDRGPGRGPDAGRPDGGGFTARRDDRRGSDWTRSRFDRRDDRWTQSRFQDRAAWNRGWRGDRRYDWNDYRADNRSAYRLPRYYAPYGAGSGYRRFGIGVSLQSQLWGRNYWIADPYAYRLPEAYGPYRWVRYYDDALLVDLRTGLVADAVYGIFW